MAEELKGKKIAILAADGVEQLELDQPRAAVEEAGAQTELLSIDSGEIQAVESDINPTDKIAVDRRVSEASVEDYDGLILPGGVANPDTLRMDEGAVQFVREFFATGKPVGVICHGPWTLIEADVARSHAHLISEHPHRPAQRRRRGR